MDARAYPGDCRCRDSIDPQRFRTAGAGREGGCQLHEERAAGFTGGIPAAGSAVVTLAAGLKRVTPLSRTSTSEVVDAAVVKFAFASSSPITRCSTTV